MPEKINIKTIPYYMIISKCSGMALDVMEENPRMFYPLNTPLQHWSFEDRGNGYVSIINRRTHEVLDVKMACVENGTAVHMWQDVNAANQLWLLEPVGNDTYRIRAKHSNRYLDICDQSLHVDAQLNIWDESTSDTQLWIIREVIEEPKPEPKAELSAPIEKVKRKRGPNKKSLIAEDAEKPAKRTRKTGIRKPRKAKAEAEAVPQEPSVAETPAAPKEEA